MSFFCVSMISCLFKFLLSYSLKIIFCYHMYLLNTHKHLYNQALLGEAL